MLICQVNIEKNHNLHQLLFYFHDAVCCWRIILVNISVPRVIVKAKTRSNSEKKKKILRSYRSTV